MIKKIPFPAIVIAIILISSFGILSLGHVLSNRSLVFLGYGNTYGLDYKPFFSASENIIHNFSPYVNNYRYVTTPIPAIFNIIFVPLGFNLARVVFYVLIPLSLASGFTLLTSIFGFPTTKKHIVLLAGLVCLLFGFPFYFLIHRENIDGWVFLFLCLGLFLSQKEKMYIWSGLFISLAIAFKIYPIMILIPFFIQKVASTIMDWFVDGLVGWSYHYLDHRLFKWNHNEVAIFQN
jgi:hypothetical protein